MQITETTVFSLPKYFCLNQLITFVNLNQNKDPVEKITTFTLGNQKILAWVGTLDPLFGCRVIPGIPENFILKGAVITRT